MTPQNPKNSGDFNLVDFSNSVFFTRFFQEKIRAKHQILKAFDVQKLKPKISCFSVWLDSLTAYHS